MKVVIMGCGRFGAALANRFSAQGDDVGIIDVSAEAFEMYLGTNFTGRTILGDGIDEDVLREAGIETAEAFVSAARGDNHNLMAAQIAKIIFGVKRVVARCNDPVRAQIYGELGMATMCQSELGSRALFDAVMDDAMHEKDLAGAIDRLLVR